MEIDSLGPMLSGATSLFGIGKWILDRKMAELCFIMHATEAHGAAILQTRNTIPVSEFLPSLNPGSIPIARNEWTAGYKLRNPMPNYTKIEVLVHNQGDGSAAIQEVNAKLPVGADNHELSGVAEPRTVASNRIGRVVFLACNDWIPAHSGNFTIQPSIKYRKHRFSFVPHTLTRRLVFNGFAGDQTGLHEINTVSQPMSRESRIMQIMKLMLLFIVFCLLALYGGHIIHGFVGSSVRIRSTLELLVVILALATILNEAMRSHSERNPNKQGTG